jgi:hypothetical protein
MSLPPSELSLSPVLTFTKSETHRWRRHRPDSPPSSQSQSLSALPGQVFDVLGDALRGRSLRDMLIEAVRYGEQPDRKLYLTTVVDGCGSSEVTACVGI